MEEKLLQEIAKLIDKDVGELSVDKRFNEELGADSSHKFMIVAVIEELTGKRTTYQKFNKCKTIGEALVFMSSLLEK